MTDVLVRIWPDQPIDGVRWVEKSIARSGQTPLVDDPLYIEDLNRTVLVYRVPESVTPGYDAELHMVVRRKDILLLIKKEWIECGVPETKYPYC